jgi:hypothetical protein
MAKVWSGSFTLCEIKLDHRELINFGERFEAEADMAWAVTNDLVWPGWC